jgi:hypothetical protein
MCLTFWAPGRPVHGVNSPVADVRARTGAGRCAGHSDEEWAWTNRAAGQPPQALASAVRPRRLDDRATCAALLAPSRESSETPEDRRPAIAPGDGTTGLRGMQSPGTVRCSEARRAHVAGGSWIGGRRGKPMADVGAGQGHVARSQAICRQHPRDETRLLSRFKAPIKPLI